MPLPILDDERRTPTESSAETGAGTGADEAEATFERRGVANPRIIDLIAPDRDTGEVVLKIFEPRPWGAVDRQLHQLEDKLNAYLGYILDGFLVQQYPRYQDRLVRIHLECVESPGDAETPFLEAASRFAEAHGLRFTWETVEDTSAWRAPWETGEGGAKEPGE